MALRRDISTAIVRAGRTPSLSDPYVLDLFVNLAQLFLQLGAIFLKHLQVLVAAGKAPGAADRNPSGGAKPKRDQAVWQVRSESAHERERESSIAFESRSNGIRSPG